MTVTKNLLGSQRVNLSFHDKKFEMLISLKWSEINALYSYFFQVDILHRMPPLWMLCFITLTFIFKIKHYSYSFAMDKNCAYSQYHRQICLNSHGPVMKLLLFRICSCFRSLFFLQKQTQRRREPSISPTSVVTTSVGGVSTSVQSSPLSFYLAPRSSTGSSCPTFSSIPSYSSTVSFPAWIRFFK